MSEVKKVYTESVGFTFSLTVESERRSGDGRYPDKDVSKMTISGHGSTFDDVASLIDQAKRKIREVNEGG